MFSFGRLKNSDPRLGVEMSSTGEARLMLKGGVQGAVYLVDYLSLSSRDGSGWGGWHLELGGYTVKLHDFRMMHCFYPTFLYFFSRMKFPHFFSAPWFVFIHLDWTWFLPTSTKTWHPLVHLKTATRDDDQVACFGVNAYEAFLKGHGDLRSVRYLRILICTSLLYVHIRNRLPNYIQYVHIYKYTRSQKSICAYGGWSGYLYFPSQSCWMEWCTKVLHDMWCA